MDEDKPSDTGYDVSDGEWLSYAELAARRGIDRQSAFKLAARHRWRRQKGNAGQVRVFVPSAFAEPEDKSSDERYDLSHHLAAFETALVTIKEAHQGEVRALEGQIAEIREAHAGEAAALRERLTDAQALAYAAQEAARKAQDAAEALRQAAEAGRKARGRLRRAWDGWRGR